MAFKRDNKVKSNFSKITIGLASPEEILENSYGEVTKPETINYRTYKPERDGLFCERIFGPTKDYECACGKYKRIRYKGIVCDRCGVEVTEKKVRRERAGHIELVVPVAHIWYFRSLPNKIGYLLGLPTKKLEQVIYYEKYIVIQPGVVEGMKDANDEPLNGSTKLDLLSEDEYINIVDNKLPETNELLPDDDPKKFIAKMGAEAIYDLLCELSREDVNGVTGLDLLAGELRERAANDSSQQRKTEALKRLQVVNAFNQSKGINRPEWMIMKIVPVTPPDLRPLVPLDGGRFATSDLNDLYRRVIIRKLIERGIVKTVKSAKKIVDRRESVIWDILENVMKGHPVLLNRAPTLHRLGIQAFQPKLIEGKAIQLHPLACTAFNADFDGDQMAVHLPLSNEAVLEAQMLMLQSHNILNPANGAPITVPSQDMVLGLYYITKLRPGALGEGLTFYGPEEALIARNEGKCDLHAKVNVRVKDLVDGVLTDRMVETSVGRIIVNQIVPDEIGYFNGIISKKSLRGLIADVIKAVGMARACEFLDGIKNLGYRMAYLAGLSFNLDDIIVPDEKEAIVQKGQDEVDQVRANYGMGFITDKERYNQVIDAWTHVNNNLKQSVMKHMTEADQGFNAVYMMLDSGARGSADQIAQLAGMRGLMAKPQKAGAEGAQIIENPILSNFKEGMSVLEYFIASHGARKGLADTAMKTADAGYLTRRLVDVSHDVIITEEDCGTLRGLECRALKNGDEVISSLSERILGRVSVHDVIHPSTNEVIVAAGEEITEDKARAIEESPIEMVEIRSVLTCESQKGVCMKCYGRNLATARMVQLGEAVGVIAAQAIGEPGTQLTLRTFHAGGVAGNAAANAKIVAKNDCKLEFDELRTVPFIDDEEKACRMVVSRLSEVRFVDVNTNIVLSTENVPYGATLYFKQSDKVKKGDLICKWDPFNAVIVSEYKGKIHLRDVVDGITYRTETDEATGLMERIITESKDKNRIPTVDIVAEDAEKQADGHYAANDILGSYNLPVGGHLETTLTEGTLITTGQTLVKIPRSVGGAGDITGGLPRVTELFEARNPSNPAVVSEIDGEVELGKVKRGNREIIVTSKTGEQRKYLVSLSKQILVQEHDAVRAGTPLSDGVITPADILAIKGLTAVQEYIVNEVQDVYRLQGVKINDKHFEIIVRQMMRKVQINDPGDTTFLELDLVDKLDFAAENDRIWGKKVVTDKGDSESLYVGQIITVRKLRDENSMLKRRDLRQVQVRDTRSATATQVLQGITRAALGTKSFMSAASFQETTKVLNEAAIRGKSDLLEGMKENVICGHLIPAGTGLRQWQKLIVGSQEEHDRIVANRKNVIDFASQEMKQDEASVETPTPAE